MSAATIRAFFVAWNARDMDRAMTFVAEDCHYDDLTFATPHVGMASVMRLVRTMAAAAPDVRFVTDEIADGRDVGVLWHIERRGERGLRGVSLYKFNEADKLVWALDAPEAPGPKRADFHG